MRVIVSKTQIARMFAVVAFMLCSKYMPAASQNQAANGSTHSRRPKSKIVWYKKSSLPKAEFLQAIKEYARHGADTLALGNAPEWRDPIARELHLIAMQRGIKNWAYGRYIWFAAGGKRNGNIATDVYKIHLMPFDDGLVEFAYLLSGIIQEDPELYNNIIHYKFHLLRHTSSSEKPRVVIYTNGKANTQKVLNILFEKLAHILGSGYRARYSAYVTRLIWVAQGNGDEKKDPKNKDNYEQPYLIYYRKDITGKDEDYHLKHPITGKDLDTPFAHQ